jgi:hypothetical protein
MKMLVIGSVALSALSAGAAYAANPNVPNWSPYQVMAYGSNAPTYANPGYGGNPGFPPELEGAGMGYGPGPAYANPGYGGAPGYPPAIQATGMGYGPNGPYANPGYRAGPETGRAAYVDGSHRYRRTHRTYDRNAEGVQNTGYDNTRNNPAYPPGFGDNSRNY